MVRALVRLIKRRIRRFSQLNHLISHDFLTSLLNRKAFLYRAEQELMRARRYHEPVVCAMLDLDCFKQINDVHGHAMGDKVLIRLSRLLEENLRRSDIIARMGGDEFCLLLPCTNAKNLDSKFDTMQLAFKKIVFHSNGTDFTTSFCCGFAEFPENRLSRVCAASDPRKRFLDP